MTNNIFINKPKILKEGSFIILAAMLIVSGFFISNALALTSITVTSPTNGEYWSGTQDITWTANCEEGDTVNIYYSTDNFESVSDKLADSVPCSNLYPWNTTGVAGGDAYIKVRDSSDVDVFKVSGAFTIDNTAPTFTINKGTDTGPVQEDIINITIIETNTVDVSKYGFSVDNVCDASDIYDNNIFTSDSDFSIAGDHIDYLCVMATDNAGNTGYGFVELLNTDNTKPTAMIERETATISDSDLVQEITVTYNETMSATPAPTITFSEGTWISNNNENGFWDGTAKIWTETFTITDNEEEITGVDVTVDGAMDLAINIQQQGNLIETFNIDTKNPTVTSAVVVPDPAKAGDIAVTVVFSEIMNSTAPILGFTGITGTMTTKNEGNWSLETTWTETFTLSDADEEVEAATISVTGAEDVAGNVMVDNASAGNFKVDTIDPTVDGITLSTNLITDAAVGTFTITVNYSEVMNQSLAPTVNFSPDVPSTLTFDSGQWPDSDTYVATYNVTDAGVEVASVNISVSGATDVAGNTQVDGSLSNAFVIDTKNPLGIVIVDTITISDSDLIQKVTVTYNETMSATPAPTITFSEGTWISNNNENGFWDGTAKIWTETFTITDNEEEITGVDVTVDGAMDLAINIQQQGNLIETFNIDTKNPTVTSAVVVPDPAKAGDIAVTVVFSEIMNSTAPILGFTGITGTMTTKNEGNWSLETTWTETFTLSDADEEVEAATISVTGAEDVAGNVMVDNASAGNFKVDTIDPTVDGITLSTNLITDAAVGTFTITVNYSEVMNQSLAPTVNFSPDVPSTLTFDSGQWPDSDTYVATYNVTDAGVEVASVNISVTGAKDPAGNEQAAGSLVGAFGIDTKNPTTEVTRLLNIINTSILIQEVTVTYNEPMDVNTAPVITLTGSWGAQTGGSWTDNTYTTTFTHNGTAEEIFNAVVVVADASGATDVAGNVEIGDSSDVFEIDTKAPTVEITSNESDPTNANSIPMTATFSEVVSGFTENDITVSTDSSVIANSLTTIDNNITFNFSVIPTDGVVTVNILANVVTDLAGNDNTAATQFDITYDKTNPTIDNFNAPVADDVYTAGVDLEFIPNDTGTIITCSYSVDNGTVVPVDCTAGVAVNMTISGLSDGRRSLIITVTDAAGNSIDSDPVSFVVNIDNTLDVPNDFTTIQEAVNKATTGNTIEVAAGVYVENVVMPAGKDNLQLLGAGSDVTSITPISGRPVALSGNLGFINGVSIRGFTLVTDGANYAFIALSGTNNSTTYTTDLQLEDIVVNGGMYGIGLNAINRVTLNDVYISNITGGGQGALELTGVSNLTFTQGNILKNTIGVRLQPTGDGEAGAGYGPNHNIWIQNSSLVNNSIAIENQDDTVLIVAINNWWGSNQKSDIEAMTLGSVNFDPWYLDNSQIPLSANLLSTSDQTGPTVELTNNIGGETNVKEGDMVEITTTFSDDNGLDTGVTPTISISNTEVSNALMSGSGNVWTYLWDVLSEDATADITITAKDIVGNDVQTPLTGITTYTIDSTVPVLEQVEAVLTPTNSRTPSYTFNSTEVGIITYGGGCSSATIDALEGNNLIVFNELDDGTYSCTITVNDAAKNSSNVLSVNTFTVDTIVPIISISIPEVVISSNVSNVPVTISSNENGTYSYSINDDTITGSGNISAGTDVNFNLDLSSLSDGIITADALVEDAAGNTGNAVQDTATKDTTAPEITNLTPSHATVTSDATPTISAEFIEDSSGIDTDSIVIIIDDEDKTDYAIKSVDGVNYTPVVPLSAGTYTATVDVVDLAGNSADQASWSFIVNPAITTITVSSDKASLPADGSSQAVITAQVLDNGEPVVNTVVNFATTLGSLSDITASDANGRATTILTSNKAGQTTVTASYNSNNGLVQGTVNVTFTEVIIDITPDPVTIYNIPLSAGWNLVSLPLIPNSIVIGEVLANISSDVDIVWYYDDAGAWLHYEPEDVSDDTLETMEDGKGYWIYMDADNTLIVNGVEMPEPPKILPTYPVVTGWNLIGFKSVDSVKSSIYLSGVSYIRVYDGNYSTVAIDNNMNPGSGYWLYANVIGNIVP